MAGPRDDQATPDSSSDLNDAATVARLEAIAKSPDPMAAAFGTALDSPVEAPKDGTQAPPPPPATPGGNPGEGTDPKAAEPRAQPPDPDTASPEELRAYAKAHPNWSKAMGLEVRDYAQRRGVELQREQQARQAAEQQAAYAQQQAQQAAEQARLATEYYEAFYDEDSPQHLDALRFYAQLGVQPVEIQRVIGSPVVQQHVAQAQQQAANQAAYQAEQSSYAAAIRAASDHPLLGKLGADGLEEAWKATSWPADGRMTPATVLEFYEHALQKAGYLDPKAAEDFRMAARQEAQTRVFGDYPPAEGSVVPNGTHSGNGLAIPFDKTKIDPHDMLLRGFSRGT